MNDETGVFWLEAKPLTRHSIVVTVVDSVDTSQYINEEDAIYLSSGF